MCSILSIGLTLVAGVGLTMLVIVFGALLYALFAY